MSHTRFDEICDEIANLRQSLSSYDGSNSFGAVTPEMELEYQKIADCISELEKELQALRVS